MAGGVSDSQAGVFPRLQQPKALSQQLLVGSNQIPIPILPEKNRSGDCKKAAIDSKKMITGGPSGMAGGDFKFQDGDFPPLTVPKNTVLKVQSSPIPGLIDRQCSDSQNKTVPSPIAQEKQNLESMSLDLVNSKSKLANAFEGRFDYKPLHHFDGKPCISFKVTDKLGLLSKIKNIVIAKFSHLRPKYQDFRKFLLDMKFTAGFKISIFDNKHLFVEFECFEDFVKLWMLKSCAINGYRVRFFMWKGDFHPTIESSIAPIWVHLPRLPLYLFDEEAIISIASVFGNPIYIDPANLTHDKIGVLSFCVARDVLEKGPDILWIEFVGEGIMVERFRQEVHYGAIPDFCTKCNHIGHSISECKVVASSLLKGKALEASEKKEMPCSQECVVPVSTIFNRFKEGDILMTSEDKGNQAVDEITLTKHSNSEDEEENVHATDLCVTPSNFFEEGEIPNIGEESKEKKVEQNSKGKGLDGKVRKFENEISCTSLYLLSEKQVTRESGSVAHATDYQQVLPYKDDVVAVGTESAKEMMAALNNLDNSVPKMASSITRIHDRENSEDLSTEQRGKMEAETHQGSVILQAFADQITRNGPRVHRAVQVAATLTEAQVPEASSTGPPTSETDPTDLLGSAESGAIYSLPRDEEAIKQTHSAAESISPQVQKCKGKQQLQHPTWSDTVEQVKVHASPITTNRKGLASPSWSDSVDQNIPMDFSIPPFHTSCDDVLIEELEDRSEEGECRPVENSEDEESGEDEQSSEEDDQPPLSKTQQLENFEKISKKLSGIKSTRIITNKYVLKEAEKWSFSEEEQEDKTTMNFNLDPIMIDRHDGQTMRLSKLIETKAKMIRQRSVSPEGHSPSKLKNLKTKLGALDREEKFMILLPAEEYEERHQLQFTRQNKQKEEEWATPKRRGRPPKRQHKPKRSTRRVSPSKAPEPRKRGRPKKQA